MALFSYGAGILLDFVVPGSFSFNGYMPPVWSLRQSLPSDASWIAELRAQVMRPDLERLGRWDPVRVRQRFLTGFHPAHTFVIDVGASAAGVIAVRPESDEKWIEHFYLAPEYQGQGLGSAVLRHVLEAKRDHRPFRLTVLQGSPARRLYERTGFVHEHEDSIDVFLVAETDRKVVPRRTRSR
ncbi:GNAT family N-acetyltransferase [Arthrobacter sp. LAR12-1-1.1]|uniref:GNAT family N-acetyltransferase n=1 Tax=Arthrobacter sp. LAR12-1-1.1 TaxID=3135215 RepID=UPI0039C8BABD